MSKSKVLKFSVILILSTLLLLSPLSFFPVASRKAQAAPKNKEQSAEPGGDVIDADTMRKDLFPGTEALSMQDLLAVRDPYTETTMNPDGTLTKDMSLDPVHWQGQDGNWQDIDASMIEEENDDYSFANAANFFKLRLSEKSSKGKTACLDIDGKKFKLDLIGEGAADYEGKGNEKQDVTGG